MKHLMMLLVALALVVPSVGCCWSHGMGYGAGYGGGGGCPGGCPNGACGSPYGAAPGTYQGAYYGGTTTTAGLTPYAPYAYGQAYPVTAAINPLPTY